MLYFPQRPRETAAPQRGWLPLDTGTRCKILKVPRGTEAAVQDFTGPCSNVGHVSYQRGPPVSWFCKRSCRGEEGAWMITDIKFPATLIRRESQICI